LTIHFLKKDLTLNIFKMKKLITIIFVLCTTVAYSQILEFEADYFSLRVKSSKTGKFLKWTDWEESGIRIVLDTQKDIINIYSKQHQRYSIYSKYTSKEDHYEMEAVDEEGLKCKIEMIRVKPLTYLIYVRWDDLNLLYQMRYIQ